MSSGSSSSLVSDGIVDVESRGQRVLFVESAKYLSTIEALYRDGFTMCVDLTAVDYLTHPGRSLRSEEHTSEL